MMIFWSTICERRVNKKCHVLKCDTNTERDQRAFVINRGYHDVSIRFPLVTSTVQHGEGVVYTGHGRNVQ